MRLVALIFFSLFFTTLCCAQDTIKQHKVDSLNLKLKKDSAHIYRFKKVRPFFSLDNRNSFIKDAPVNVQGLQLGMVFKDRHTFGFGLYSIRANSHQNVVKKSDATTTIDANRTLSLNYLTIFYQYAILDYHYFELDMPLELGLGGYEVKLVDPNAPSNKPPLVDKKGGTLIIGGGVGITIKPLRWIGIAGSAGYRNALDNDKNVNFSGFYYSYGVWLNLGRTQRDIRYYLMKRKKCRKQIKHILTDDN